MIATDHAAVFSENGTYRTRAAALRLLPSHQVVLLAADWAETVLPVWERAYPSDARPRRAIEAVRGGDHIPVAAHAADAAANAGYAAAYAGYAANAAGYAAGYAANAAGYAAHAAGYAAAYAAHAAGYAAHAAHWDGVRRLWESAYHDGHVWHREWRTPLAVEMARDPADYPVLLDLLEDAGAPVEGLREGAWALSSWAIYHLMEEQ